MAPPPPSDLPTSQRLLALAQTLQFAWFAGHVTLLLCALRYSLSYLTFNYYSSWAKFSYRTTFVAACATYGIVVYKAYRARMRSVRAGQASLVGMVADENVQYLAMAIFWLISKQMPLAILPFAVYSVFHVATYTRQNLLPTLQPQPAGSKPTGLSETIGRFVKDYYDSSMTLVALLEISLWFRILGSAILFQRGSWILLVVYSMFFRIRLSQSTFVQSAVANLTNRVDGYAANANVPPAVRNIWNQVKAYGRQLADTTDVNRFLRQQQGAPKKAQ